MNRHPLYYYVKNGTTFDHASLLGPYATRYDCLQLDTGDSVGVAWVYNLEARKILEAVPGITVLPPLHRPIKDVHAAAFSHVNAQVGEVAYDIVERLFDKHCLFWMHPETHL